MSTSLLIAPAVEPLTLAEAKAYLRVEHDDEDGLIAALVTAARSHVEAYTKRALMAQTWRATRDAWPPSGRITLLPAPLRQVVAARVYDAAGVAQACDMAGVTVDRSAATLAVSPWSMPQPGRDFAGIEIDFEAGYAATPSDLPEPLRQAVRLLAAHWYENRALAAIGETAAKLPATVAELLAPYRVLSL